MEMSSLDFMWISEFSVILTIIPRARMGSDLMPKAEWATDTEAMMARGIIVK